MVPVIHVHIHFSFHQCYFNYFRLKIIYSALQEYNNLNQLFEASKSAVKARVNHVLLKVNKPSKWRLKWNASSLETLLQINNFQKLFLEAIH